MQSVLVADYRCVQALCWNWIVQFSFVIPLLFQELFSLSPIYFSMCSNVLSFITHVEHGCLGWAVWVRTGNLPVEAGTGQLSIDFAFLGKAYERCEPGRISLVVDIGL
jgi:hypothetical protein